MTTSLKEALEKLEPILEKASSRFVRLCLDFENALDDESLNSVIRLIVEFKDAQTLQLGCVWLDGAGYGGRPVEWLGQELLKETSDYDWDDDGFDYDEDND